jgi:hypothetical protein
MQLPGFSHDFSYYMTQAKELLAQNGGGNTVFIATDEPSFVEKHRADHPDLKIHTLGGPGQVDLQKNVAGTEDFFDLFVSLELAGRCKSIVANFDSNVSNMLFMWMCFLRGQCPPYKENGQGFHTWVAVSGR